MHADGKNEIVAGAVVVLIMVGALLLFPEELRAAWAWGESFFG